MQFPNATGNNCEWCGMIHSALCPRIKSIEYEGGMIKRIEFHGTQPLTAAQIPWQPQLAGYQEAALGRFYVEN